MPGGASWHTFIAALAVLLATGCGSSSSRRPDPQYNALVEPGTRAPSDEVERAILGRLETMPPGSETSIEGHTVVAGPPYHAASARTCRRVTIRPTSGTTRIQLACKIDDSWSFVPEVLQTFGEENPGQ